jgi:hypothetical protein
MSKERAVTLMDIADLTEEVEIRGRKVKVWPITAENLLYLMNKFEAVKMLMQGQLAEITTDKIMDTGTSVVSTIIAMATTERDEESWTSWHLDPKVVGKARKLGATEQLRLVNAIFRITFPDGLGPFVAQMQEMGIVAQRGTEGLAPASLAPLDGSLQMESKPGLARGRAPLVN